MDLTLKKYFSIDKVWINYTFDHQRLLHILKWSLTLLFVFQFNPSSDGWQKWLAINIFPCLSLLSILISSCPNLLFSFYFLLYILVINWESKNKILGGSEFILGPYMPLFFFPPFLVLNWDQTKQTPHVGLFLTSPLHHQVLKK